MTAEGEYLLSDQIVFFLGAGASRTMGYPLMSTFLDDLKKAYPKGGEEDQYAQRKKRAFDVLLTFRSDLARLREYVHTDFDNIEELYSAAEMFALAYPDKEIGSGEGAVCGKDIPREIAIAIWEMCRLRPFEGAVHKQPKIHIRLMQAIANVHGKKSVAGLIDRVTFITTNYDILIELAASKDTDFSYGASVVFGEFRGDVKPCGQMNILKLHGSVNWFLSERGAICDASCTSFKNPVPAHGTYIWPRIQGSTYEIPEDATPMIVPPSFSKSAGHPLLQNVWREAITKIARAKLLVFIGYSFPRTDTFVNHLLHVGLLQNADLRKVMIVDPAGTVGKYATTQVFDQALTSKGRVQFVQERFTEEVCNRIEKEMEELETGAIL